MPPTSITQDEYDVYTTIFRGDRLRFDLSPATIADETSLRKFTSCADWTYAPPRFRYLYKRSPNLTSDFEIKNQHPVKLERRFEVPSGFQFLSERPKQQSRIGNYFSVSRVGFDREKTHGLVYFCYYGDPRCVRAWFLLMRRDGYTWREIDEMLFWMA